MISFAIALGGCASKQSPDLTDTVSATRQEVIAQKEADVNTFERKLDAMRDNVHAMKFRATTSDSRRILNQRYTDLGVAKAQLSDLRNSIDSVDFYDKQASLDNTLSAANSKIDGTRVAE